MHHLLRACSALGPEDAETDHVHFSQGVRSLVGETDIKNKTG